MPDLDESIPKVQKGKRMKGDSNVIVAFTKITVLDMPELERIPRYKNEFHNNYRDPFSFHPG